jgi:hypothetical protein
MTVLRALPALCVLAGLVLVAVGTAAASERGLWTAALGLTLACLAGAELRLRR